MAWNIKDVQLMFVEWKKKLQDFWKQFYNNKMVNSSELNDKKFFTSILHYQLFSVYQLALFTHIWSVLSAISEIKKYNDSFLYSSSLDGLIYFLFLIYFMVNLFEGSVIKHKELFYCFVQSLDFETLKDLNLSS